MQGAVWGIEHLPAQGPKEHMKGVREIDSDRAADDLRASAPKDHIQVVLGIEYLLRAAAPKDSEHMQGMRGIEHLRAPGSYACHDSSSCLSRTYVACKPSQPGVVDDTEADASYYSPAANYKLAFHNADRRARSSDPLL